MMSLQSGVGSQASLWGLLPIIAPAQHSCLPTLLPEARAPGPGHRPAKHRSQAWSHHAGTQPRAEPACHP